MAATGTSNVFMKSGKFCLIPFKKFSSNPFLTIIVSTTALAFCSSKYNILEHVKD